MKKFLYGIYLLLITVTTNAQTTPFTKGINLTGWFQANSPTEIHFKKYTIEDLRDIQSLGVDVIRLPINLHSMTLGEPDYELHPLFLELLDQVVDWCEELGIHLILDNHTFDPAVSTDPSIEQILIHVWRNMAAYYNERSELIYYEILNEPHGIDDPIWNEIQKSVIDEIRKVDSIHTIVVGPAGWNSYNNLKYMPEYDDDNLIYTFHYYDPFLFTHQGASWTDPSLVPLAGVPFPYNASKMPSTPAEFQGSWIESSLNNYYFDGTISKVRELIDIAVEFKNNRNVPIFCGEFGVYIPNSDNNDRLLWYHIVRTYMESKGIAWTTWDYHGGFGLFEKLSGGLFDYDLNTNLLAALGFNIPPQEEYELLPDTTGFTIYSDFIESNISGSSYTNGVLNFYDTGSREGTYCISWEYPAQYNHVGFKFLPVKDLSCLAENNYSLGFWLKSDNPASKFDIRFIDTKENAYDHPWRMGKTLDHDDYIFDNSWRYIEIPLTDLIEKGSWDDDWFNPRGLFDWGSVEYFQIVDEHGLLSSTKLWFDEIKIFDPAATGVDDSHLPDDFVLHQNYPNPFNPSTVISFQLAVGSHVELVVYDILGREVETLINKGMNPGKYRVNFDASGLAGGVYFYQMVTEQNIRSKKMIILR